MYIMIGNNQIKETDININDINPENITLNKKPYRYIFTYYIAYETSNGVKPLFIFNKINGYIEDCIGVKH